MNGSRLVIPQLYLSPIVFSSEVDKNIFLISHYFDGAQYYRLLPTYY